MGQLLILSSLFGMGPRHSSCVSFGAVKIHMYTACLCFLDIYRFCFD